jgi:GAF domain-containing protein
MISDDAHEYMDKSIRSAANDLKALQEIAAAVNSAESLEQVIDLIVQKVIAHLKVEQASVTLLEKSKSDAPLRTMIRKDEKSQIIQPYRLDTQITGWILLNKTYLIVNDPLNDGRFHKGVWKGSNIGNVLVTPLIVKGEIVGSINAFNKLGAREFTVADKDLLSVIAAQAAQLLENTRLYEKEEQLDSVRREFFKYFA